MKSILGHTAQLFIIVCFSNCNLAIIEPTMSYNLEIVSGTNQLNALAMEELAPFVVKITKAISGEAVVGEDIRFEVMEGGGSFQGNSAISVTTNTSGQAAAILKMGTKVFEINKIEVRLVNSNGVVVNPVTLQFSSSANRFKDERNKQTYRAVKLNDGKVWMAENLNYSTLSSWCYDNSSVQCTNYGRMYTWDAAINACPSGWHLPTDEKWREMAKKYGGASDDVADGGLSAYQALLKGVSTGFDGLLGGYRHSGGDFLYIDSDGQYWTRTESNTLSGMTYRFFSKKLLRGSTNKALGISCRCVQD